MGEIHDTAARGFPLATQAYEQGRPTYPSAAAARLERELGLRSGRVVLDLAAGTGKLTALLVGTRATVIAVEPVAEMRAALERALPSVTAYPGTAEAIPLDDSSVDAVTVGQAFHWFRGDEALAEIHRVLRPGGGLGIVFNVARHHRAMGLQALGDHGAAPRGRARPADRGLARGFRTDAALRAAPPCRAVHTSTA